MIPTYVTTQGELNTLEHANVLEAQAWAFRKPRTDILNATFALELHKRMFNRVWTWAGVQRRSDKNIGDVAWAQIPTALASLFGDAQYWIDQASHSPDEIAARFHRRLVWIHAFANGNGRHARLMTDVLLLSGGQQPFSWGEHASAGLLHAQGSVREEYIAALKEADAGQHDRLLKFARS